jgi:hypothetical protein
MMPILKLRSTTATIQSLSLMSRLERLYSNIVEKLLPTVLFYFAFYLPFLSPTRPSADAFKHAVHVFDVSDVFWFPHHVLYAATLLPFARLAEQLGVYPFIGFRFNVLLWAELFLLVMYWFLKQLTSSVCISRIGVFFIASTYVFISFAGLTEAYVPSATVLVASLLFLVMALQHNDNVNYFFYGAAILALSFATTLHQIVAVSAFPLAVVFVAMSRLCGADKARSCRISLRHAVILATVFLIVAGLISFAVHIYGYVKSQDSRPFTQWLMHYREVSPELFGTMRYISLEGLHRYFCGLATAFSGSAPFLQNPKQATSESWLVLASVIGVTLALLLLSLRFLRRSRPHALVVGSFLFWIITEESFNLWWEPDMMKSRLITFLPLAFLIGQLLTLIDKGVDTRRWRSITAKTLVIGVALFQLAVNTKNLIVPGLLQNYLDPFEPYLYMVRAVSDKDLIVASDRHFYAYRVVFNFRANHVAGGWENTIKPGMRFGIDVSATDDKFWAQAWPKKVAQFRRSRDIIRTRRGRIIFEQHGWLRGVVFGYGDDFPLSGPLAMAKFVGLAAEARALREGVDECLMNWVTDEDREECFRTLAEQAIACVQAASGKKNLGVEHLSTKQELVLHRRTDTESKSATVLVPASGVFLDAPAKLIVADRNFKAADLRRIGMRFRWTAKDKVFWIKLNPDLMNRDGSGLTIDLTFYPWIAGRVIEEMLIEADSGAGGEAGIEAKVVANRPKAQR